MCLGGEANWKREVVPDHKFDFVDIQDYKTKTIGTRLQYLWLYALLTKSFAVYLSDLFTAITMLTTSAWSNDIFQQCQAAGLTSCVVVPFGVGKWIFVGCIIFGYLLLMYEAWKANKIVLSHDISYAFTNVMANNYYSFRSYAHFCFFCQIENSTKKKDDFAFFVFFTFKGWKRLLLADGPRQAINALTLYSFWLVNERDLNKAEIYWSGRPLITKFLLSSMLFTVVIFAGSMLVLLVAAVCYIPLLCYIRGNLKEYCCHKVDKRISELMKKKTRQRVKKQAERAQAEARGDYSHLKNKNGELAAAPAPQPTLPILSLDDDVAYGLQPKKLAQSNYASSYAASSTANLKGGDDGSSYYRPDYPPSLNGAAPEYPPPMPVYDTQPYPVGPIVPRSGEYDDSMYNASTDHHEHYAGAHSKKPSRRISDGPVDAYYASAGNQLPRDDGTLGAGLGYGAAYDEHARVPEPTTPHRRTRSRGDAVVFEQAQIVDNEYQQQWPGYGPGQHQDGYPAQQPQHGRNRSRGFDDYSQGGHAL